VVLASPAFMHNGPSRELFELWAPDARNGLIITGYAIQGTLARVSGYQYLVQHVYYMNQCHSFASDHV
jgi:cleavage and polyadenylation specificity factor subunit 3